MTSDHHQYHVPVLLKETIGLLSPEPGERYLDMTAGYGGHAEGVLEAIGSQGKAVLVDRDEQAQGVLQKRFGKDKRVHLKKSDFTAAAGNLAERGEHFDMILLDLGMSSPQVDLPERGFSFTRNGPLDMRMDQEQQFRAQDVVNTYDERQLAELIQTYGEEPQARRIAKAIKDARPLTTTGQLAKTIEQVISRRPAGIHPATRTFQALRIVVNDELGQIKAVLPLALMLLETGGRLAVITFHSLEDRIVKRFLQDNSGSTYDAQLKILTKKPIQGKHSDVFNPRARSAKLRGAVKINTNTERG